MNKFNFKKGFTLVELLVVISIISLLASVGIASLGTTRVKAADAAIKSDLQGIRSSSEIEYATLGYSYNTSGIAVSTADAVAYINSGAGANTILRNQKIKDAIKHIASLNGGSPISTSISADGKTYSITLPMKTAGQSATLDSSSPNISYGPSAPTTFYLYVNVGTKSGRVKTAFDYYHVTNATATFIFEYSIDQANYTQYRSTNFAFPPVGSLVHYQVGEDVVGVGLKYFRMKARINGQDSAYTIPVAYTVK